VFTMGTTTGATAAFKSPHINFSLTDGSTDFIVGDAFTFVVGTTAPTVIGGTGTGVMTAISVGKLAQRGNYRVINRQVLAAGGEFDIIAPDGSIVGHWPWADSGSTEAFVSDHISFTLSDSTDYILNNYFDVAVYGPAAAPKVVKWDPTATDGRQYVAGIAWDTYDATSADVTGAVITARGPCVVNGNELSWISTAGVADKVAGKQALTALGIVAR
jgi:hypothetical protein